MDLLDEASPEERDFLRAVLLRSRIDRANGEPWFHVTPFSRNLHYLSPVPCLSVSPMPALPTIATTVVEVSTEEQTTTIDTERLGHRQDPGQGCAEDEPPPSTSDTDAAILQVLKEVQRPLKVSAIAQRAKLPCNSYFYERIRKLRERELIKKIDGGLYWLSVRPLPPE